MCLVRYAPAVGRREGALACEVGCAIALVANYLFWPRDTEAKEPVPAAMRGDTSRAPSA